MKIFLPILLISSVCLTLNSANNEVGYYWLDYNGGKIPVNALKIDETDPNSPYVGQVYTKEYELLPATIRTTRPYATFTAYNRELSSDKNIKVLCSQYKTSFNWVQTSAFGSSFLPNLIVGGFELGGPSHFGRITRNGTKIIGKLSGALVVEKNGRQEYIYYEIEALTYERPDDYIPDL